MESILRIIDIDINNLKKEEIIKNVDIFRRKVGNDLIQNNLYKSLPNTVKCKKNSIHLKLINNDICDENIYKYISYYCVPLLNHDKTHLFLPLNKNIKEWKPK